MHIATCLKMAEYAKSDPSLIPNHTDGKKGVDFYLNKHLEDIKYLLTVVVDDAPLIEELRADEKYLTSALNVYATP